MRNLSPLRYPGGKGQFAPVLSALLDENEIYDFHYVEPFAGGAAVAFELLATERAETVHINDYDISIYSIWNAIFEETEAFLSLLFSTEVSVNEWERQRTIYLNSSCYSLELGFAAFYLNRTNYSGILSGKPIGGMEQTGSNPINARYNPIGLAERIRWIARYRDRVLVTHLDGRDVIASYRGPRNAVVYADPPYVKQGNRLYMSNLQKCDHLNISDELEALECPWLVTYDNDELVIRAYKNSRCATADIRYVANVRRNEREFVATNLLKTSAL